MVRVLSVHHFTSQDVVSCPEPVASVTAGNLLLLASPLHQVEVRDLSSPESFFSFPTVDLVENILYSPVGRYVLAKEVREDQAFVRVYINWWNKESVLHPMRARVAAVTPGNNKEEQSFEMIELVCGTKPLNICVCSSTGNLIILTEHTLNVFKYTLASQTPTKYKYIDFQLCMQIHLSYMPSEIQLTEDIVSCLSPSMVHVFKVKLEESGGDEDPPRSLSMYSFSSDSDASVEYNSNSGKAQTIPISNHNLSEKIFNNVTERRRMDSSCEREINKSSIRKHPDHILLGRRSSQDNPELYAGIEVIRNPLVNNEQREIGSLSSPNILEQIIGPCSHPPYINIIIETNPAAFQKSAKRIEGTAITLVYAKISENEKTEKLGLLTVHPVYWREFRVRRNRTPQTPEQLHNPLQSMMYSHLMSVTLMFTSTHEGYLYHVPGHIRRQGKGVGVQKIATYPFTSPVKSIVLEPSLIHALTETGLETYTLRSGYHTVREAELIDDITNACPPKNTPICLIGLRPFLGVKTLVLGTNRLVLLAAPSVETGSQKEDDWTIYSLHIPDSLTLYQDMLTVAEMNIETPHGHLHLLSEAHLVLRTALHKLTWLQVMKPNGVEISAAEVESVKSLYNESCVKLADHYLNYENKSKYSLSLPYYRMSGLPILSVLDRFTCSSPLQASVKYFIQEVVLRPTAQENILDSGVTHKIILLLGENCLECLVHLLLHSSTLRGFKSALSLEFIESKLRLLKEEEEKEEELIAEMAVAAVLIGGSGTWLNLVPVVQLSSTLLKYHELLLDQTQNGQDCLSDLALALRLEVPVVFTEICVSLIESNIWSLGQVLQLLLQTFMSFESSSTAADNAAVLQLFLETYFMELLSQRQLLMDVEDLVLTGDQQQALLTLLRSYLASLTSHSSRAGHFSPLPSIPADNLPLACEPGEFFGSREEFLELLPPYSSDPKMDCSFLLKLESLLCSPLCNQLCKDTVARYLDEQEGTERFISLRVLSCLDPTISVQLIHEHAPGCLQAYCEYNSKNIEVWSTAVNLLYRDTTKENELVLLSLLESMGRLFPPEVLLDCLPEGEHYKDILFQSRRNQQADRLQQLIVTYSTVAKL